MGTWLDASGWADVVGLSDSLVGIAGVPFVAWNAWRAKLAAVAAQVAAAATSSRIRVLDAVRRLTSVLDRLDELLDQIGVDEAGLLTRPLREQRRGLIQLSEAGGLPSSADQSTLRDAISTLRGVEIWLA